MAGVMVLEALWYALFGWKDAPIMEFEGLRNGRQEVTPMGHDRRFGRETKLSAIIAAFPKATVILEHPSPVTALTNRIRCTTMRLPWARTELSLCNWEPGLVDSMLDVQKRMIVATAAAVKEHSDVDNPE